MKSFVALCIFASFCVVALTQPQQCRDEHGTPYRHGEEPQIGDSWFRCWGGHLSLAGCVTSTGSRLVIGQSNDIKGYEMTCRQISATSTRLQPTSCIYDDQKIYAGQTIRNRYYAYTCMETETGVALQITACIDDSGREVAPGQTVVRGEYQYECALTPHGYVSLEPVGCIYDGAEYPIGTTFNGEKFWFTCEKSGGRIRRTIDGCIDQRGQRIRPGQTFHRNGFVVQCETRGSSVLATVTGCLQTLANGQVVEKSVGSEWKEGTAPFQYTVYCTTCSDGSTVMRSRTKCAVGGDSFTRVRSPMELEPGCMRRAGSQSLACCGTTRGGGLELHMDEYNTENLAKWQNKGFRLC